MSPSSTKSSPSSGSMTFVSASSISASDAMAPILSCVLAYGVGWGHRLLRGTPTAVVLPWRRGPLDATAATACALAGTSRSTYLHRRPQLTIVRGSVVHHRLSDVCGPPAQLRA